MSDTFDGWMNENDCDSLRMERIYDDLVKNPKDTVDNWQQTKFTADYDEFLKFKAEYKRNFAAGKFE